MATDDGDMEATLCDFANIEREMSFISETSVIKSPISLKFIHDKLLILLEA